MKLETAINLIKKTKKDYSKVAFDFSVTRKFIWSEFLDWKDLVKEGDNILDFGCGNGRLIEILKDKKINYFGVDLSEEFIKIARSSYPNYNFQTINEKNFLKDKKILPFSDKYFNIIFCIATFHHIPSKKLRKKLLKEFYRILKFDGYLIISVWNLKKIRFFKYLIKYTFLKICGKMKLEFGDCFIPYQTTDKKYKIERYLHIFSKRGLKKLVEVVGFKIERIFYSKNKNNLILILKK